MERKRLNDGYTAAPPSPFPTPVMLVCEDPSKFAPGNVVIEDGKSRPMMITKIVVGFAECLWLDGFRHHHFEIVHTSMLTLDANQKWMGPRI